MVALGRRADRNGIHEVGGSIPPGSTIIILIYLPHFSLILAAADRVFSGKHWGSTRLLEALIIDLVESPLPKPVARYPCALRKPYSPSKTNSVIRTRGVVTHDARAPNLGLIAGSFWDGRYYRLGRLGVFNR
jgi:hypothetical protein